MQNSLSKLTYLVGNAGIFEEINAVPVLPVFSDQAVSFLADLSRELLQDKRVRSFADVTAYAYWIRQASLELAKQNHPDRQYRIGRGIAFHVAPSNVPVNFAVSMTSSLLAGNVSVIRVSNKSFEQVDLICEAINKLVNGIHIDMSSYLCLIRYDYDDEVTEVLSAMCDVRVIWGGNNTIAQIRRAPISPRAIELTFADRHSLVVIDAAAYLRSDAVAVAKGFYTDTYYTDQNACSSPRIVVWMGKSDEVATAKSRFWDKLSAVVHRDYDMKPIQSVEKYSSFCDLAMDVSGIKLVSSDNYIVRVEVEQLFPDLMDYKNGGGYFFEYTAGALQEIVPLLGKACQTVSVLGIEKRAVWDVVRKNGVRGVDRIVQLGQTMGLEFIWDGYKMIEAMSRYVYIGED